MKTNAIIIIGLMLVVAGIAIFWGANDNTPIDANYPTGIVRYSCTSTNNYLVNGSMLLENSTNNSCSFKEVEINQVGFNLDGVFYETLDKQLFRTVELNAECNFSRTIFVIGSENKVYGCNGIQGV